MLTIHASSQFLSKTKESPNLKKKNLKAWKIRQEYNHRNTDFPDSTVVKNSPAIQEIQEMWVPSLGWEDPLEEGMATHFSILAWRIPWTEEPGGLQSMVTESDVTEASER